MTLPVTRTDRVRRLGRPRTSSASALEQVPQDVLHDAAVAVVVRLTGGVDADHRVEGDVARGDLDGLRGAALVELGDATDGEGLLAGQAERLGSLALGELERDDAHADQVRPVDALVGL